MTVTVTQEVYKTRSIFPVRVNPSIVEGRNLYEGILGPDRSETITRYAPTYKEAPILTGSVTIPSTLSCSTGVVEASPMATVAYQWFSNGVLMSGQTNSTYVTQDSDNTKTFFCTVTATNTLGSVSANSNSITATLIEPTYLWEANYYTVSGVEIADHLFADSTLLFPVSGLPIDEYSTVFAHDLYSVIFPVEVAPLSVVNPGAEDGTTGWTSTQMSVNSVVTAARTGTRVFKPTGGTFNVSAFNQTVPIGSEHFALIDANRALVSLDFYANNKAININYVQGVTSYLEAISGSGAITQIEFFNYVVPDLNIWTRYVSYPKAIPVNTRSIKIYFSFESDYDAPCEIDDIAVKLWSST